jgi:hypothetical protein
MTLKVSEPERGPGLWKMNYTVIQTDLFKHIFESFWNKWKLQKNNFKNKLEWWEQTKIKIKSLTIGVSKKLNITETKLKIWETTLEKLVESNSDNKNKISELRCNINKYAAESLSHPSEVKSFSKKITCSSKIDTISSLYLPSLVLTLFHSFSLII